MGRAVTAPDISVVIPFYAGEMNEGERLAFLYECLTSVKAQTLGAWEALVVDDGSRDEFSVRAVIEHVGDERIRYLRHPVNRGLGAARNTGFRAGSADILLPLDSDDRLHATFLERTYAVICESHEVDGVFTHFQLFGGSDRVWQYGAQSWERILREQWIPGPGVLMRRATWETAGGYAEIPGLLGNEDWDFWIAALSRGINVCGIPQPLYEYRFWAGSLTFRYPPQDGHVARRIIHTRHRALFRAHSCSRPFLAGGYLNSSIAALGVGRRGASLRSAAVGLLLSPRNSRLWRQATLALLPARVKSWVRAPYRALSGASPRTVWLRALELVGREHYDRVKKHWWDGRARELCQRWGDHRADFDVLARIVREQNVRSVLDVGCGHGRLFKLWQELGVEAMGIDISSWAISRARAEYPHFTALCTPLEEYEPDRIFDLVVSNRTLQHVEPQLIPSILSSLCPSARFIYVNEISQNDEGQPSWYLWFHDFKRLLQDQGLILLEEGAIGTERWSLYGNPVLLRQALPPEDSIRLPKDAVPSK